ncbi:MAG: nucleotidyltransferase family protein [Muribaculaceae bacterium]|nr:nucleotidyltransferase family protein [Muribaculaceae bacterium]
MKAIVFAAGLGTRLKPITDTKPKALVDVAGTPALGRVIGRLKEAGVDEMVVNVHHFAHMIERYLAANDHFGITIHVSDERDCLLDTGGGLLAARQWLGSEQDDPIIVHNADIMTDFPIRAMLEEHQRAQAMATLLVADRPSSRKLLFDSGGYMRGWININTGQVLPAEAYDEEALAALAFGGVHVVSSRIFKPLEQYARRHGRVFSITPFYIDMCRQAEIRRYTPEVSYHWYDIGRMASLEAAETCYREKTLK